jgi:hypothetical protein
MKQAITHCIGCKKEREVDILCTYKQSEILTTISEGDFIEEVDSVIVQCKSCECVMTFYHATPESISDATPISPELAPWMKGNPYSDRMYQLDKEARDARTESEKVYKIAKIIQLSFNENHINGSDFIECFDLLRKQKQLNSCFDNINKILMFLEDMLTSRDKEVAYNDRLDIQRFYLALMSELYETPSLINDFDKQWNGFSNEYFGE